MALWDTGATGCVISKRVIRDLDLKSVGIQSVYTASSGDEAIQMDEYRIHLMLPNKTIVPFLHVIEGTLNGFDMLVGMDVITRGDFAITHKDGNTIFSFQIPSTHDIDFVKDVKLTEIKKPTIKERMPRPNDPCPCGSGKKWKNCHGKSE